MTSGSTYLLAAVVLLVVFGASGLGRHRALPFPPGPTPLPFIGNYLSLPTQSPWATYASWCKTFRSDLISINVFGQSTVIVNSKKAAKELFEHRSAKYSDRPLHAILELTGWEFNTAFIPYSEKWRTRRRLLHETLHSIAALAYRPLQRTKVHEMLGRLHSDPDDFVSHVYSLAASIAMSVSYGEIADKKQSDKFLGIAQEANETLGIIALPGAFVVNTFPFLRFLPSWLPGMGFKSLAQQCRRLIAEMRELPWAFVKQGKVDNPATPSMASRLLNNLEETSAGDDIVEAAKDTVSAMLSSILGLLLHPHVQERAHKEIDSVIGRDRLPTYQDRDSLPYVEAIYREVLRWHPVLPLSVTRAVFEDDIYEGYFIPKAGTSILANVWSMTRDAVDYPEPESFKPERFLTPDGTLNDDNMQIAFGLGRRVCVGQHLADSTAWMMIVSMLAVFRIVPAKDENGKDIIARVEYTSGLISHPLPFKCAFQPRDGEAEILLAQLRDPETTNQI
ncbi:cytochrome P450 [Dentipellis sp. KUC8613]|nr:cytochrome P450 [Dentipellis sp. KUC8613]